MAPMKNSNNNRSSSTRGGDVAAALRQANILASCYVVDPSASSLRGLHYCTSLPAGAECPPLAAITATNELALTPKAKSASHRTSSAGHSGGSHNGNKTRRGGATSRIRGECERFFCETLRAAFLGERSAAERVSRLTDVYQYYNNDHANNSGGSSSSSTTAVVDANGQLTPPDYCPIADEAAMAQRSVAAAAERNASLGTTGLAAWLEIWDYAGGNSFRGFVAEDDRRPGTKTLFVFFDTHVVGRDLKQALVALIELAEGPLACEHMVIAVDRGIEEEDAKPLLTGLQWAGFSITTLDFWTGGMDVTSEKWLFMGMEV